MILCYNITTCYNEKKRWVVVIYAFNWIHKKRCVFCPQNGWFLGSVQGLWLTLKWPNDPQRGAVLKSSKSSFRRAHKNLVSSHNLKEKISIERNCYLMYSIEYIKSQMATVGWHTLVHSLACHTLAHWNKKEFSGAQHHSLVQKLLWNYTGTSVSQENVFFHFNQ